MQIRGHTDPIQSFPIFQWILLISLQDGLGHTDIRGVPNRLLHRDLMITTLVHVVVGHTCALIHIYTVTRINRITGLTYTILQGHHNRGHLEGRTRLRLIRHRMVLRLRIHPFPNTCHVGNGLDLSGLNLHHDGRTTLRINFFQLIHQRFLRKILDIDVYRSTHIHAIYRLNLNDIGPSTANTSDRADTRMPAQQGIILQLQAILSLGHATLFDLAIDVTDRTRSQ